MKRIIACLMAGILMLALVGCGTSGSSSAAAKKDYTQILHDARSDEDNEYLMIFTKGEDGKFTAQYGYSAEYEADQLSDEVANMMMPLLGLEDGMYDDFAASVSGMMVIVCTAFLYDLFSTSFKSRATRMGSGKQMKSFNTEMISVFLIARGRSGKENSLSKFSQPTHGLPSIPYFGR